MSLNTNHTNYTNRYIDEFVRFRIFVVNCFIESQHESHELYVC